MNFSCFFIVMFTWLPSGNDFHNEALEFMRVPDAKGIPLFNAHSFQKAEAQRDELRADSRDWEGVIAEVLDPKNDLEGYGAALSILRVRDSFGDKRVAESLKRLLDLRAKNASEALRGDSDAESQFRGMVGQISKFGTPELIQFVCERLLEEESNYYSLFDERRFSLFLNDAGARGSEINLTALRELENKLEGDGKTESAERAGVAAMSIKRRFEAEERENTRTELMPEPTRRTKGGNWYAPEIGGYRLPPWLTGGVLIFLFFVGFWVYIRKARRS